MPEYNYELEVYLDGLPKSTLIRIIRIVSKVTGNCYYREFLEFIIHNDRVPTYEERNELEKNRKMRLEQV